MAERIEIRPLDDRCVVWVCPVHGIVDEGGLLEGVDWSKGTDIDIGDVCWTDRFYCDREHAEGEDCEVAMVDVMADIAEVAPITALNQERNSA